MLAERASWTRLATCLWEPLNSSSWIDPHFTSCAAAYKQADGRKVDGRRIVVDVERGRTVPGWRPRRLGGGLGSTRTGADMVNQVRSRGRPRQPGEGQELHCLHRL